MQFVKQKAARRRRCRAPLPRAAACMFISTVDFVSAVSFGGELRGDLAYRLRSDLLRQIVPSRPVQLLVTS
jgi:hypothetical protein